MSAQTGLFCVEKNYSYQHIQGVMLLNLNKLACELKLNHSEYRLLGMLIGHYNKCHGKAFPTLDYLANYCCMGKQTISKALNNLVELNLLVVVKTPGRRNNYYFSNLLLTSQSKANNPVSRITCKTPHDNKQIKNITNKSYQLKQDSSINKIHNRNDVNLNNPDTLDYKQVIEQLTKWNFIGTRFIIKCHGVSKIKSLIELVKTKNPDNPGAYLRSLLDLPEHNIPIPKNEGNKKDPTGAIFSINQIKTIDDPRLSRSEIIEQLEQEGKIYEVSILRKLWRML